MSKALFIRGLLPAVQVSAPGLEFTDGCLWVEESNENLLWHLRAFGYEEVEPSDPRWAYVKRYGWGNHQARMYEIMHQVEEPVALETE